MSRPDFQVLDGGAPRRSALGRVPPHNLDAERGLMGIVLISDTPEAAVVARQVGVRPAAFYEPALRVMWQAVEAALAEGQVPDMPTMMLRLSAGGQLEQVGGMAYLMRLSGGVATSLRLRQYAEEVKLLWERRHAIEVATKFVEDCYGGESATRGDFTKLAGELGNRLVMLGRVEDVKTLGERIGDVLSEVKATAEGRADKSRWLPTGMALFDKVCGPLGSGGEEDRFVGVAAGSSYGKSALVRQWTHNWTRAGRRVLVYTRETSINGWVRRAASQAAGINLRLLDQTPKDKLEVFYAELAWLQEQAANRFLFVYQNEMSTPLVFVEDLVAHYNAFEHLHGKPDAVIVDYLQILLPKKKCNSREQEVAYVSHLLQGRQRQAGNVWVVTAQMNEQGLAAQRLVKKDDSGRLQHRTPLPGDLRESQAFFHDADRMICIYRPPEDCTGRDQVGEIPNRPEQWLCQIKGREVGVATVKTWFNRPLTRFEEWTRAELTAAEMMTPGKPVQAPTSKEDWKKRRQGGA